MIRLLIIFFVLLRHFQASGQLPFVLNGRIQQTDGMIDLFYLDNGQWKKDSTQLVKQAFSFQGTIPRPAYAYLLLRAADGRRASRFNFWLEPGTLTIASDSLFRQPTISGSKVQNEFISYQKAKDQVAMKYAPQLDSLKSMRNQDSIMELRDRLTPYFEEIRQFELQYFLSKPNSFITAHNLMPYLSQISVDTLEMIYRGFGMDLQASGYGLSLKNKIDKLRMPITKPAADFNRINLLNRDPISLQRYRGKYILMDFWASWCVPCRKEHAEMIGNYHRYKRDQIEFIGISTDDDLKRWQAAVRKDKLPWPQILANYTQGDSPDKADIDNMYDISILPTLILIDRQGMIIGRYPNFTDAAAALEQLLSK